MNHPTHGAYLILPRARPIVVFAMGDVNNDGAINMIDYEEFELYWIGADANHTQTTIVDFSAPGFRNTRRDQF